MASSSKKESRSTDAAPGGSSTVRVAAVQMRSTLGDVHGNMARADALIRHATEKGAKFVVLPETALHGYLSQNLQQTWHISGRPLSNKIHGGKKELMEPFGDLRQITQTVPGPITDHYVGLSVELGTYIVVPFIEKEVISGDSDDNNNDKHDDYRFYNGCVLTTPDGSIGLHYRKNHLWPLIDNAWASAGDSKAIMDTPYGRVGLAICFDVHVMFDRYRQCREEEKLWTLLYPIAWVDDLASTWFDNELPRRVQQAGFHVVGANWSVDQEQPWNGYGFSRVIRSDGLVVAKAETSTGDEIVLADLEWCTKEAAP